MDIYEFLHTHKIPYERYDHEAVFTCEQADLLSSPSSAAKTKNLFLRDRKGRRHFLVTVDAEKSVRYRRPWKGFSRSGLEFHQRRRLMQYLGLTPGSVTILAVLNDPDHRVG